MQDEIVTLTLVQKLKITKLVHEVKTTFEILNHPKGLGVGYEHNKLSHEHNTLKELLDQLKACGVTF
jgi:hypothetical protein